MAIGPIGRAGSELPVFHPTAARQPRPEPAQAPVADQNAPMAHASAITRTYSVIRIDESNKVSVKVFDADTDEVVLEAPPTAIDALSETLQQAIAGIVSRQS